MNAEAGGGEVTQGKMSEGVGWRKGLGEKSSVGDGRGTGVLPGAERRAVLPSEGGKGGADTEAAVSTVVRMRVVGANGSAEVGGEEELSGKVNYFIGNDPSSSLAMIHRGGKGRSRHTRRCGTRRYIRGLT